MQQFLKQMQQHADYGTRVMETETIQKDGASLKIRMSRENFKKIVLTITATLFVFTFFAQDYNKEPKENERVIGSVTLSFSEVRYDVGSASRTEIYLKQKKNI